MEYHGKLYGKIGHKYFDTGKTSADYDKLESEKQELLEMLNELFTNHYPDMTIAMQFKVNELIKRATE